MIILYNKVTAPTASHITKQSELSVYERLLHFFIIHPALSSLRTQQDILYCFPRYQASLPR